MTEEIEPKPSFPHGNDCQVTFLRRADNEKALVAVWHIKAKGYTFLFHLIRMKASGGPWVFGSINRGEKQVWKFRDDPRVQFGFKGATYTVVDSAKTYVVFEADGQLMYLVPFVPFLIHGGYVDDEEDTLLWQRVAKAQGLTVPRKEQVVDVAPLPIEEEEVDQQQFFINVISRMCK